MRSYSIDLRERIVWTVEAGQHALGQLAEIFAVNVSAIGRFLSRYRSTGSVQPKSHGGGVPPKLDAKSVDRLLELVSQQPDATLRVACPMLRWSEINSKPTPSTAPRRRTR